MAEARRVAGADRLNTAESRMRAAEARAGHAERRATELAAELKRRCAILRHPHLSSARHTRLNPAPFHSRDGFAAVKKSLDAATEELDLFRASQASLFPIDPLPPPQLFHRVLSFPCCR